MKKPAEFPENPEYIFSLTLAPLKLELMMTGLRLKVFDCISLPATASEVAARLGTHEGNTAHLLDHLATIGLVDKRGGRYGNKPETERFLVSTGEAYMGPMLHLMTGMWPGFLPDLEALVRSGPQPQEHEDHGGGDAYWADYIESAASWARAGYAQQVARLVASLPEFDSFGKMLDLGAGPAITTVAIVGAHPSMTGVAFDLPPVAKLAERYIAEYGMADRISVLGGDFTRDDIGSGYGLVWASSTLNHSIDKLDDIVAKVYAALEPGGVFASLADGMTHERTQPDIMLGHAPMTFTSGDTRFDQGFIAEAMLRAGFRSVHSRTVHSFAGDMDLDVARK